MGVARVCSKGYVTLQCKCGQKIHPGQPIHVETCTHDDERHALMRKAPDEALELAGLKQPSMGRLAARNEASVLVPYGSEKRALAIAAADQASNVWEPIVRSLVGDEPGTDMNDCGYLTCFFCLADEGSIASDHPGVIVHKDDCAWLLAKEALRERS